MDFLKLLTAVKGLAGEGTERGVADVLGDTLICAVKTADSSTNSVFFEEASKIEEYFSNSYDKENFAEYKKELQEFSAMYICNVLSTVTDYSFHDTVVTIGDERMTDWFSRNHTIGEGILFQEIYNQLKDDWAGEQDIAAQIREHLLANDGLQLVGLAVESDIQAIRLLLIALKKTDGSEENRELNQVMDFIKGHEVLSKYGLDDFSQTPWLLQVKADFMRGADYHTSIRSSLLAACGKEKVTGDEYGIHYLKTKGQVGLVMLHKSYGEEVEAWVNSTASKYHLNSGTRPKNRKDERAKEENLFGCVVAGTEILMEDGSLSRIEDIREGDLIRNATGGISVCSGEKVVNRTVDYLYSVNGDTPFMSLDHAVLTGSGWRCPRPDLAKKINDHYVIGMLEVGDVIVKADPEDGKLVHVKVEKINTAANTLPCYDLHFSDGCHSYIADGYCTLLNYPEITADSVARKMDRRQFDQMRPVMEKTFGNKNIDFDSLYGNQEEYETDRLKKGICLMDLCLPGMKIVYPGNAKRGSEGDKASAEQGRYKRFFLYKGYAVFDGEEPAEVTCGDNMIYWKREVMEDGSPVVEEGIGRFLSNRTALQIKLVRKGKEEVLYAMPDFSYQIQYRSEDEEEVKDFAVFHMKYELDSEGNPYTVGEIRMDGVSKPVSESCSYSSRYMKEMGGTVLCVKAEIQDFVCAAGYSEIKTLDFHFDLLFEKIAGTALPYIEEGSSEGTESGTGEGEKEKKFVVLGSLMQSEARRELKERVAAHVLRSGVRADRFLSGASNPLRGKAVTRLSNTELSVAALCNLPELHDLDKLHNECFAAVRNMAMYVMTDDELKMCGETRPVKGDASGFTTNQAKLADQEDNKTFLQNEFTAGYFSSMFANCNGEGYEKVVEKFKKYTEPKRMLGYFWQGTQDGCFCRFQSYKGISQNVYDEIYLAHIPDLEPYLAERKKWAKEMYEYTTNVKNPFLLGLITTYSSGGSERLEHLCAILRLLDDDTQVHITDNETTTYGQALRFFVTNMILQKMAGGYKGGQISIPETECQKFIESYIRDMVLAILNGTAPYDEKTWDHNIRKELQSQIKDLNEALGLESEKAAIDMAVGSMAAGVSILFEVKSLDIPSVMPKVGDFLARHSLGSAICKTITLSCMYAVSLYQVVGLYKQYNKMTDLEKAALISQTIGMGYSLIQDIFSIVKDFKEIRLEAQMRLDAAARESISDMNLLEGTPEKPAAEILEEAGEAQAVELEAISDGTLEKTTWEKFCEKGPKIIGNVINVVIMGITTAVCIVDTMRDFKNDESALVKAFDIAGTVGFGMATLTGIAGLFVTTGKLGKFIPYVGTAFVIVGMVASLVLAIVGKKKPEREESAAEKYITAKCIPFMDGLPEVPADWKDASSNKLQLMYT